ncbi:MAG: glycine betaine ABC transporter substrate-binding protein [Candidatus Bipolaricaulota bacterium]|nr:glycine betaine ABC transporter substrate-binding protein [Candidatus Bipolaricaulota bacterium]MBS3791143.1 glycine betaine ABC transporter substrate-binding protein [Candidatus Bipolaricaulota bacterium]
MKKARFALVVVFSLALTIGFLSTPARAQDKTLNIGAVAWEEALGIADLIQYVVRTELGMNVEVTNPSIGVAYAAASDQELDLLIESWQPITHQAYTEKYGAEVIDFGPMYEDAKLTWAVPTYVPEDELASVEDLAKESVKEKLGAEITGIDPGAGIMQQSEKMLEEYDALSDYDLLEGSGAAMQAALKDATQNEEWIVVTLWEPHSAYGRFDLRNLEEPKGLLGSEERVHMIGRQDFMEVFPNKLSEFISRFYLPIGMVNELSAMYSDMGEGAGAQFAEEHPEIIDFFVNGVDALG